MTDPFSIAVGIFGLSSLAVKLIAFISSYVDSVRGARADVQALSVGTSAVYKVLGRLKLELDRDPEAEGNLTEGSRDAARRVLEHCKGTLLGLERMVEKAQVVNMESGMERVVKTVRWKFKEAEIGRFKERLRDDKGNLKMVLQVLSREQDDKVVSMLEEISQRMSHLSQEREGVKETFGVVEQGDPRASITIFDRRGEPLRGEPERHGRFPPSKSISSTQEWKLLEEAKAPRTWSIRSLDFKIHTQPTPTENLSLDGQDDNIQLNLRRSKRLELWFSLGETVKTAVQRWFNEHARFNTIGTSAAVLSYLGIGRPFVGSYSISFWDVRKHGEDTILLVPSGSGTDFFLFDEIKVQFKNEGEDETQLTQAAMEEEALGWRWPTETWHDIEPFLETWYWTGRRNLSLQASEANAFPQDQDAEAPTMSRTVLMDNRHPEEDTDNESEEKASKIVTAASEGRTEVVRTLLSGGARVNVKHRGWTALGRASKSGHLDVVHVLIESGANLDIKMDKGWGMFPGDGSAVNWAAHEGHLEIVKLLAIRGARLDIKAEKPTFLGTGGTPLTMAAGKGRLDIIRFLLEYGTDKLLGDGTNGTDALVCACEKSQTEVVKYFMEKGFDVRSDSSEGRTPLHAAAEGERPDIMELLVHHGAVLDATDQAGNTPLHATASIGSVRTALWLRRRGSDLTARNHSQQTPHMIAKSSLERRQSKCTERLVEILDWNVPLSGADADDRQECVML